MCKNIALKANLLQPRIIYDISEERITEVSTDLGAERSKTARSIPDAAKNVDIVFYSVPDDRAVLSVLNEILAVPGRMQGKLIVDCSTVHPDTGNEEARLVAEGGGDFVACPVFGVSTVADAGQLICALAGRTSAVERILPFCQGVMARAVINFSSESDQDPSQATQLKIIGNSLVYDMLAALSESHVLAEKSGMGCGSLHEFIEVFFPGPYAAYSSRMLTGDYHKREVPVASVGIGRKDAQHVRSIASKAGTTMKNVDVADHLLEVVQKYKGPTGDIAAMYGAKRLEAGMKFEN